MRGPTAYLPDNIYDALANFKNAEWTTTLLGEDVKSRYADLKQASADRCPRLLGTFVKAPEVHITTKSTINSSGTCSRGKQNSLSRR